ncbi:hypothetical protein Hamer_G011994 [Homarus americanus]|uniref:CUB domain-containing protein n=2 Tax=Homarus americanus TaxID=6706 RepID=A0A8J5JK59_HOMAM|nr:hypothetical protein Hamer_G011994 [Homarus americanus]
MVVKTLYGGEDTPVYGGEDTPVYGGEDTPVYGEGRPGYGEDRPVYGGSGGGGLSRKDDTGITEYGGDSPFFIKLPGSPNAVPVFLQYEPIQIKYVPSDHAEDDKPGTKTSEDDSTDTEGLREQADESGSNKPPQMTMSTPEDVSYVTNTPDTEVPTLVSDSEHIMAKEEPQQTTGTNSFMSGVYRILDDVVSAVNNQVAGQEAAKKQPDDIFTPHRPIIKTPDPFFLMEAPQLGTHDNPSSEAPRHPSSDDQQNDGDYTVDLSSKLSFEGGKPQPQAGTVEDVPLGMKQEILYPGDYYSHDVYAGADIGSLLNPVFELSTKTTTLSHEERMNPQYTPFPITANPPRRTSASTPTTPRPTSSYTPVTDVVSDTSSTNTTDTPMFRTPSTTTTQKILPSIEYSPIPATNFDDSYDSSFIPQHLFNKENQVLTPYPNTPSGYPLVFHGPPHKANEGATQEDDTRKVSAVPFMISDVAVVRKASSTPPGTAGVTTTPPTTTQNAPPPSEHFMAHQQVWSFPQSREEPGEDHHLARPPPNPRRVYSAFYSPLEVPGLDPSVFGYRKVPQVQNDKGGGSGAPVYTYDTTPRQEESSGTRGGEESSPHDDQAQHVFLGPKFFQYLNSLPYALLHKFLDQTSTGTEADQERLKRSAPRPGKQIFCEWDIKTEQGLYLLMTFHNLSASYSVDCNGAYIEVERENNGYDARWCGNRVSEPVPRPHVIFAKTEVRITVYDDGDASKSLPTGFEADIEVIDLFDSRDYNSFMRSNAYPHIRRLLLG